MRAIYTKYGIDFLLKENQIITLVVESPRVMNDMLRDLFKQTNGEEGGGILSEQDKIFPLDKISLLVDNPLTIDCNEKKILTKLYKELSEQTKTISYEDYTQLNAEIVSFLDRLLDTVPYHMEFEMDPDISTLLKAYSVKIQFEGVETAETLIDYLRVISAVCSIRIVWILNLKQFLAKEQVKQLYEFCFYEKIYLINLEGHTKYTLEQEKSVIIDEDLCVIYSSVD